MGSNPIRVTRMARQFSWLECRPVTAEVMGSSPIRVAICNLGSLLVLIPYLALYSAFASVAQLVEQGTENPRVSGSIPL